MNWRAMFRFKTCVDIVAKAASIVVEEVSPVEEEDTPARHFACLEEKKVEKKEKNRWRKVERNRRIGITSRNK
jgi:hypothetical protein